MTTGSGRMVVAAALVAALLRERSGEKIVRMAEHAEHGVCCDRDVAVAGGWMDCDE